MTNFVLMEKWPFARFCFTVWYYTFSNARKGTQKPETESGTQQILSAIQLHGSGLVETDHQDAN